MTKPGTFLVIDDHVDNRYLLTRTIGRKFPQAEIKECGEIEGALSIARTDNLRAIVCHRVDLTPGIELIRQLLRINPAVPIIMVSSYDRTREALVAGASRFLLYDQWLRIGTVIEEVLAAYPHAAKVSAFLFAIERRHTVGFRHSAENGAAMACEVEPHVLGRNQAGVFLLRGYAMARGAPEPAGTSGWATYRLENMQAISVTERLFAPQAGGAPVDPTFVEVVAQIEGSASAFIPRRPAL